MNQPNLAVVGNEVDPDVERLWAEVFKCSQEVIQHSKRFGFIGMHEPDPNIHDFLMYVQFVMGGIKEILDNPDGATFEEIRLLLNAQHQFATLKLVARALQQGNRAEFEAGMQALQNQAQF